MGNSQGSSSVSRGLQPLLQENLVTVNADHIAPMNIHQNNKSRPGQKASSQMTPQTQNVSTSQYNQTINAQAINNAASSSRKGSNASRQPNQRDEDQSKTERELTEWLNDAYKRKR